MIMGPHRVAEETVLLAEYAEQKEIYALVKFLSFMLGGKNQYSIPHLWTPT